MTRYSRESRRKPIRNFSIDPASSMRTSIADPVSADPVSADPVSETPIVAGGGGAIFFWFRGLSDPNRSNFEITNR